MSEREIAGSRPESAQVPWNKAEKRESPGDLSPGDWCQPLCPIRLGDSNVSSATRIRTLDPPVNRRNPRPGRMPTNAKDSQPFHSVPTTLQVDTFRARKHNDSRSHRQFCGRARKVGGATGSRAPSRRPHPGRLVEDQHAGLLRGNSPILNVDSRQERGCRRGDRFASPAGPARSRPPAPPRQGRASPPPAPTGRTA